MDIFEFLHEFWDDFVYLPREDTGRLIREVVSRTNDVRLTLYNEEIPPENRNVFAVFFLICMSTRSQIVARKVCERARMENVEAVLDKLIELRESGVVLPWEMERINAVRMGELTGLCPRETPTRGMFYRYEIAGHGSVFVMQPVGYSLPVLAVCNGILPDKPSFYGEITRLCPSGPRDHMPGLKQGEPHFRAVVNPLPGVFATYTRPEPPYFF